MRFVLLISQVRQGIHPQLQTAPRCLSKHSCVTPFRHRITLTWILQTREDEIRGAPLPSKMSLPSRCAGQHTRGFLTRLQSGAPPPAQNTYHPSSPTLALLGIKHREEANPPRLSVKVIIDTSSGTKYTKNQRSHLHILPVNLLEVV
jgi:hypothetical protein